MWADFDPKFTRCNNSLRELQEMTVLAIWTGNVLWCYVYFVGNEWQHIMSFHYTLYLWEEGIDLSYYERKWVKDYLFFLQSTTGNTLGSCLNLSCNPITFTTQFCMMFFDCLFARCIKNAVTESMKCSRIIKHVNMNYTKFISWWIL